MTKKYVERVQPVEAMQLTLDNLDQVKDWSSGRVSVSITSITEDTISVSGVPSIHQRMEAQLGWWLVMQGQGTFRKFTLMTPQEFEWKYQEE